MGKGTKAPKYKAILINRFLAANLQAFLERDYRDAPNRVVAFSEKSKVSYGSVHRALKGKGVSMDILEEISVGLGEPAWKLLYPHKALRSQMKEDESVTELPDIRSTDQLKQSRRLSTQRRITK